MERAVLGMLKNARNMVAKIPGELRELRTAVAEQQAQIALELLDAVIEHEEDEESADG